MASPTVPCLVGMGTDERVVDPRAIPERMARWPGGRLEVIAGARHEVLMERPELRGPFVAQVLTHFAG